MRPPSRPRKLWQRKPAPQTLSRLRPLRCHHTTPVFVPKTRQTKKRTQIRHPMRQTTSTLSSKPFPTENNASVATLPVLPTKKRTQMGSLTPPNCKDRRHGGHHFRSPNGAA